jgi:murein DD-endopeptidase MepM/ murein hydrolase activator NlpD
VKPYTGGVRHDYKESLAIQRRAARRRRWSWLAAGVSLPVTAVALLLVSAPNESKVPLEAPTPVVSATPAASGPLIPLPLPANGNPVDAGADNDGSLAAAAAVELVVSRGDTLDQLFRRHGLSITDLTSMVRLPEASRQLRILQPGDRIAVTHVDGRVQSLTRELDEIRMLVVTREDDRYAADTVEREVEIRTAGAHGVIRNSLFGAGVSAGISDMVIMHMAAIFQWDIDFILDVRVGDEFTVIYEELWRDGTKLRDGEILAAEFVNQGRRHRAARFIDGDGRSSYFTPDGRSVRRAFLRAPVDFTRISSNFDPNRRHPVLNTIRAHRGVDYAAPTGTPIRAAGDGRVQVRGVQGGYGNTVILEHGGGITTLYAHMSRFGSQRVGSRVRQGDVIGFVGMTGLATGPHLHYEYRVNGVHRNPRTVPLPDADPIPPAYRAEFDAATAPLWRQVELYQRTQLAALTE